ncbi:hypothetical protein Bhyg_12655 [Pseudolycoriella hygida]|uniref:Uncharacterized protein n=1 Tax=Pseudolycoriella hygida TaxID=35572 RepID=A0A9Q0MXW4_9DIPT|nr:hypothetical protein Bhyg_12655 [Pseudolycoriella hygida]
MAPFVEKAFVLSQLSYIEINLMAYHPSPVIMASHAVPVPYICQKNTKHLANLAKILTKIRRRRFTSQAHLIEQAATINTTSQRRIMESATRPNVIKATQKRTVHRISRKTNETVFIQPGRRDQSLPNIQEILEFVEGSPEDATKKVSKKSIKKQKKWNAKRIKELEQMREEFHEVFFKELDAKNELKCLKAEKSKDKQKISKTENSVKKFGKLRANIEKPILELIAESKKKNVDFKFAYLPTKEQQQQRLQRMSQPPSPPSVSTVNKAPSKLAAKNVSHHVHNVNPEHLSNTSSDILQQNRQKQNIEVSSERMVTNGNVPKANRQVSVAAQSSSPKKQKLVYTFVNGQLVNGCLKGLTGM